MLGSIFKRIMHTVADAVQSAAHEVVNEAEHISAEQWAAIIEKLIRAVAPGAAAHPALGPYASMLGSILAERDAPAEHAEEAANLGSVEIVDELPAVLRAHGLGEDQIAAIMHGQGAPPPQTAEELVMARLRARALGAELPPAAPLPAELPPPVSGATGHVMPQEGHDQYGRRLSAHEAAPPPPAQAPHPWAGVTPQAGFDAFGRRLDHVAAEAARAAAAAAPAVAQEAASAPQAPAGRPDPRRPPGS